MAESFDAPKVSRASVDLRPPWAPNYTGNHNCSSAQRTFHGYTISTRHLSLRKATLKNALSRCTLLERSRTRVELPQAPSLSSSGCQHHQQQQELSGTAIMLSAALKEQRAAVFAAEVGGSPAIPVASATQRAEGTDLELAFEDEDEDDYSALPW